MPSTRKLLRCARVREIGYWIAADREGNGFATEAVTAQVSVAFEVMGARRLEIETLALNPSDRVREISPTGGARWVTQVTAPTPLRQRQCRLTHRTIAAWKSK